MQPWEHPISTPHNITQDGIYGATAAFAGDRCEIHLVVSARARTEAILGRRRFRDRFREAIRIGRPKKQNNGEERERAKQKVTRRGEECKDPGAETGRELILTVINFSRRPGLSSTPSRRRGWGKSGSNPSNTIGWKSP